MKKRAVISLAVAAALASTFAFAACGKDDGEKEEPVTFDYAAPAFGDDADVTLSVQATKTSGEEGKISDTLFGCFLEDINYASYYLDDNILANSSFEAISRDWNHAWQALNNTEMTLGNEGGVLSGTDYYKTQNTNPKYAKVVVSGNGAGGVKNLGYNSTIPIAVQTGTDYVFSAFIKNSKQAFDLTVAVTDGTSDYLSETIQVAKSDEWVKYTRTITATGTKSKSLSFELRMPAGTEISLDGVTLETKDSTIGIKNTPYNAIKDLAPKFIRFPGGCIIEGDYEQGENCAYDWKNSIGAVQTGNNAGDDTIPAFTYQLNNGSSTERVTTYGEEITRTPNPDLWATRKQYYYDMVYAIGFYEYFLLCDSLGASAVPVLNCGLSCQGGVPQAGYKEKALPGRHDKYLEDFIQDAVDLIEFAKGGTNTKWGKIRADMGHPAPFEMSYLGIGNEQWGIYYTNYYEKFLENDAFMNALETYSIKPIVGNGVSITDCQQPSVSTTSRGTAQKRAETYLNASQSAYPNRKIETVSEYGVVDQHYYVNYTTLLTKTNMYDKYTRSYEDEEKYYEVFVGEYSANTASGDYTYDSNQWLTALSEAAMMTGYERNGDVVKLAAYAPMFGTAASYGSGQLNNQWGTDMMYFTNTELVLSTNYYVQQLFMKNQGAFRILDDYCQIEWNNDLSPTFELKADKANSTAKTTVNKLYYVASLAQNGDVIIKVVNVSDDAIKADFAISNATLRGNASVTVLQCDDKGAKNTLTETKVEPESFKIGVSGSSFGYEIKANSVISFTVHTK